MIPRDILDLFSLPRRRLETCLSMFPDFLLELGGSIGFIADYFSHGDFVFRLCAAIDTLGSQAYGAGATFYMFVELPKKIHLCGCVVPDYNL